MNAQQKRLARLFEKCKWDYDCVLVNHFIQSSHLPNYTIILIIDGPVKTEKSFWFWRSCE